MTGSEIKTFAESVLDGQPIDDTFFYQLLNIAKNKVEEKRPWQFLRKLDSSQSASQGNNYGTAKTIPTDERYEYKVMFGTDIELSPVGFEEQHIYRNSAYRYYNDRSTGNYYVLGNLGKSDTLYRFYIKTTDDITSTTSPVWPSDFHPLLGFYVASYYQMGVDADDLFARMSPENKLAAVELERAMVARDMNQQARSQNHQIGVSGSEPTVNLGDM